MRCATSSSDSTRSAWVAVRVRLVGGGARDDLWATIKASVLGRPVRRVLTAEATAVGAAMVGHGGGTGFRGLHCGVGCRWSAPAAIDPDPEATKTYADASALAASTPSNRRWRGLTCRRGRRDHRARPRGAPYGPARRRRTARRQHPHRSVGVGRHSAQTIRGHKPVILGGAVLHEGRPVVARRAAWTLPGRPTRRRDGSRRRGVPARARSPTSAPTGCSFPSDPGRSPTSRRSPRSARVAVASRSTACSINGFIADRSVLVVAGAKRTVESRWPDVLVADSDILARHRGRLNLAGVGDLSTVPNAVEWQLHPLVMVPRTTQPSTTSLPPCKCSTLARPARERAGGYRGSPPAARGRESSVRRPPHRAPNMPCPHPLEMARSRRGGRPLPTACRSRWATQWFGSWWTGPWVSPDAGPSPRRQAVTQWRMRSPASSTRRRCEVLEGILRHREWATTRTS